MKLLIMIIVLSVVFTQSAEKIFTLNEPINDITELKVNIDFGMGDLVLKAGQNSIAVSGYLQYNYKYTDASFTFNQYGKTGILDVETDFDLDLSQNGKSDDHKSNECELYLAPGVPLDMSIDIGFGEAMFDLEGLQLSELTMDCGFGELLVDFGDNLNSVPCSRVDIDNGLGSVRVINLANSNTDEMDFECGLGSMTLEFSGKLEKDIDVDLAVGLGGINIQVPFNTNVKFEYDGSFLSSIDLEDFEMMDENEYQSETFTEDSPTIHFSASVGAGSITLNWIN